MKVAVGEAKARLTELVRRAEAGDEVILTRHGQPAVMLVPVRAHSRQSAAERRALLDELGRRGSAKMTPGPDAARSQDYLYEDDGLPA